MARQGGVAQLGPAAVLAISAMLLLPGLVVAADGADACTQFTSQNQAGEYAASAGWERGARATVEGQPIALCQYTGGLYQYSGSFEWVAIQWPEVSSSNIFQVGYGHCARVDNDPAWGTTNCNGGMYWYFAWGSYCGSGTPTGSGGIHGAIPLRIGGALSATPPTKDMYVLRENVGGTYYYDAYVGGVLLQGVDALGNNRVARVPASSICWDADSASRSLYWFGETFNDHDSMGGWDASGTAKHLDYTLLRYSINTGWLVPSLGTPGTHCNIENYPSVYTCKIVDDQHIYVDTVSR
jgi:hypothetical protein